MVIFHSYPNYKCGNNMLYPTSFLWGEPPSIQLPKNPSFRQKYLLEHMHGGIVILTQSLNPWDMQIYRWAIDQSSQNLIWGESATFLLRPFSTTGIVDTNIETQKSLETCHKTPWFIIISMILHSVGWWVWGFYYLMYRGEVLTIHWLGESLSS